MAITAALVISTFAAIIPTIAYSIAFYWADRYEREPGSLVLVAFIWGAIPAVLVSLVSEVALETSFVADPSSLRGAIVNTALVAPIVEELAKAAALLGLFWWKRNEFDGVLDGLIYGALVGFGFAMTENFLYFVGAYSSGGFPELTWVIILRAVIFGLNHAFYTSITGVGFGLARTSRKNWQAVLWIALGLTAAIVVHAAHNFGVTIADVHPIGFALSLFIASCGLGLIVIVILFSWHHERNIIRTELAEEIGNVLTADELLALTGRWRQPLRFRQHTTADTMSLYVELAVRKRHIRNRGAEENEELLDELEVIRSQLRTLKAESD